MIDGEADADCILAAADELDIKAATLKGHLKRLGLAYPDGRAGKVKAPAMVGFEVEKAKRHGR